ncbi:MAG: AMP-binding protein, partial [Chloroflexota bacterium]
MMSATQDLTTQESTTQDLTTSVRRTLTHMQHDRMTTRPDQPSFYHYEKAQEQWTAVTNSDARDISNEVGAGLWVLGVRHADRVAVMSETRHEWQLIDNGGLAIGATVVSIYPSSTADAAIYILQHSGTKVVFLEKASHWQLIAPQLAALPDLQHIVLIESSDMLSSEMSNQLMSLDQLRTQGRALLSEQPQLLDEARDAIQPEDLASLMYTSGTTGNPKGVALTHNMLYTVLEVLNSAAPPEPGAHSVIYLPISHILQRIGIYNIQYTSAIAYFSPTLDDFIMTCQAANPRGLTGIPRVLEKVQSRILADVAKRSPLYQLFFNHTLDVGLHRIRLIGASQPVPLTTRIQYNLFNRWVYRHLRTQFFGKNIQFLSSGAAPISKDLLEFFYAIGLPVMEGYGLTETCAPITVSRPDKHKIGTVGTPLPGSEVKIADDGEVLLKGPSVFEHYYNNPEATADSFT